MNALLLRNLGGLRRSSSLVSFAEYKQSEASNPQMSSVTSEGTLLEYETLELRIHPPNVVIDNETYEDVTVITIDSANRPGTLIEVRDWALTSRTKSLRCDTLPAATAVGVYARRWGVGLHLGRVSRAEVTHRVVQTAPGAFARA